MTNTKATIKDNKATIKDTKATIKDTEINIDSFNPHKYWPGRSNCRGTAPDMRCVINKRWRVNAQKTRAIEYIAKLNAISAKNILK